MAETSAYQTLDLHSRLAMIDAAVSTPAVNAAAVTVDFGQMPRGTTAAQQQPTMQPAMQQSTQQQPAQPRQPAQPTQLQTVSQYARSMRIEARARTLRLRLVVLAGFSAFSFPLFIVGGAAGLLSALPYLVTDCTNVQVFLFLRVQRARLTMLLTSLTATLCFALVPVFLFGTLLGLDEIVSGNDELPANELAPPAPPASPAVEAAPPPPAAPLMFEGAVNVQSAFTASAIDYVALGALALLAACAARELIREAQRPSGPEVVVPDASIAVNHRVNRESETGLQNGDGTTCSICLDTIQQSQEARALPCSHTFHRECIRPWLARRHTCPECRAPAPR